MSLHIFNSINKSWKMYTHTLSSISGDHLTLKPHDGKNILLEVSANKDIFIKQGDASYNLINLINGTGTSSGIVSGSDVSLSNLDINGNLNPLVANGSSIGLDNRNWNSAYINNVYCETININKQYITQHYTQRFGNSLWNQFGQDISFSNPIVLFGISNNGRVVAITEPANSSNRGRLYVYEISFNGTSYSWQTLGLSSEILVGQTTTGNFGGDGNSVISLSSDGRVVAVNDTLNDTSGTDTGQVRVFELSANIWRQRGQLINGKPIASYGLGYNIALSGNGNILAASSLTRPSPRKGEIFVYELSGNSWIKIGQDISGVGGGIFDDLGFSMSLSLDGTTLAAGYRGATSPQVEIYRFDRTRRLWDIIGPVPGSTIDQYFGWNIKLSGDGNTIVIGGIGYGTSTGNTINGIGSVSVFKYNSGTSWSQLGQIIYGASANDLFGQWVQISNDGTIMSAGGTNSYVRVYKLSSNTWTQIGQVLNGSGIAPNLGFPGHALSGDGTTLLQMISKSGNSSMARVYGMNRTIDNILSINSDILMISGELFTNGNINPLNNNGSSLGLPSKTWGNAYIRDLSVGSIEVSGHIMPLRDLSSNLGSSLRRLSTLFIDDLSVNKINGQAFTAGTAIVLTSVSGDIIPANNLFKLGDVSRNWNNAYIRDLSVSSIDVSVNLNPLLNNLSLGLLNRRWANAYIRDVSVSSIDVSMNLNPLTNNGSSLGLINKLWGNAYIRDASVSSIDVSGNLNPLTNNGSSLGLLTRRWGNAYIRDVSVSSIDVSNNLNPLTHNGSSLGLSTRIWGNAYIRDVSAGNIDVSGNLNPFSSGTGGTVTQGTGGTITISGGYIIHSFTTTGTSTFRPPFNGSVEVLIVGGGGGGGPNIGGGGGGGGVIWIPSVNVSADTSYSIVVGAGGASGTNGQNSTAFTAIAAGGGTSGSWPSGPSTGGGSGGGASANQGSINQGGAGKVGSSLGTNSGFIYGCSGGNMTTVRLDSAPVGYSTRGAGGGGAGPNDTGKALDTNSNIVGDTGQTGMGSGGLGYSSAILGTSYYWAGGGGGGAYSREISSVGGYGGWGGGGGGASNFGTGGQGGGFALNSGSPGANGVNTSGGAGGPNTGGGGGGGSYSSGPGGTGGSGIVVIRYLQAGAAVNTSSIGLPSKIWGNAYIRDVSVNSIDVSGNLNPLLNNTLTLGLPTRIWNNAYIRDLSVSSIELSGNILPLITNNSNLGSSLNTWRTHFAVDLSVNTINGAAYSAGGGSSSYVITSIGSDILPSLTNTYNLGSTTKFWSNAYIRNLRVSNRAYQEISGDISWSAVNGHYGLAKDAYPALNPLSSGAKAVQTWTQRTSPDGDWLSICWSPELMLFVSVAQQGNIRTSPNGITWTTRAGPPNSPSWFAVCWSPQLRMFVAVGNTGPFRVMISLNGIDWTAIYYGDDGRWQSVCWSPELRMFVAGADNGWNGRVMTSYDGYIWTFRPNVDAQNVLRSICWSPELKIFVAVGSNRILTSSNGIDWNFIVLSNPWISVCWSPQLGIFVAIAGDYPLNNPNQVITSSNGKNWTRVSISATAYQFSSVCWSPELRIFIALALNTNGSVFISNNGINWTSIPVPSNTVPYQACWSPELGIFAIVGTYMTSSLKGRPPTSYNVFDSSFNNIDETGKWTFVNVATTGTLTVNTTVYNSDDRLKHNEVIINNGLTVIDQLCPKFYQKTQTLLDASYNGDLSGLDWTYEAGLIAQEVLQVPDLSFVVGGGDYYEKVMVSDVSDVRYALSYYEQKMNSDLSFANSYKEQKINNDLSFTISYYQEKMYSDLSFGFDGSYNIQQILNDLSFDVSYHILKMNNDLSFYLSYNEQKINYDLSFELNYSQQLTINDLSRPNYYEVSGNLIKQPYTLNYNSVYVYGLAAIKELHAKVKAQETSLLNRQTIINSLTSRIEALEHNLSS